MSFNVDIRVTFRPREHWRNNRASGLVNIWYSRDRFVTALDMKRALPCSGTLRGNKS